LTSRSGPTETAVVVPVPDAEGLVGPYRARLDHAAELGVPAHVTVLAPFVLPALIDDGMIDALADAVGSVAAFEVTFARTAWFGRTVLWLAPEPASPFVALTAAVGHRFPGYPPYGGAFDEVIPHLTVGLDQPAEVLDSAALAIEPGLPIVARVTTALLMQGSARRRSWHIAAELPLRSRA
jgi:hypothetical protein